jgi:Arginase family
LVSRDPHRPRSARTARWGGPLLDPSAFELLGHRPADPHPDVARENARLDPAIHALTAPEVRERGPAGVGTDAAARLAGRPAWLHLDLDDLDEPALPAVSYPQPLGLDWHELVALARPLIVAPDSSGSRWPRLFTALLYRDLRGASHLLVHTRRCFGGVRYWRASTGAVGRWRPACGLLEGVDSGATPGRVIVAACGRGSGSWGGGRWS